MSLGRNPHVFLSEYFTKNNKRYYNAVGDDVGKNIQSRVNI